jgi:hypothetical protein
LRFPAWSPHHDKNAVLKLLHLASSDKSRLPIIRSHILNLVNLCFKNLDCETKVEPSLTFTPFVFTFVPLKTGELPHMSTIPENVIEGKELSLARRLKETNFTTWIH